MEGKIEIGVRAKPDEAFAYLANLENAPEWVPDLVSVRRTSEGDVGVGTRYTETVQMGKQTNEAELEITEYDPPRGFAHNGQGGPAKFSARFVLKPDGDGTRIEHHYTVRMTGLYIIFAPLANRWVRKNTEAAMKALKTILDNEQ